MAKHMWCRSVTWRDKLWWIHYTNTTLGLGMACGILACYFRWASPLMKREASIIVGVVVCLVCCVSSGCALLFSSLSSPHRNEMDGPDFESLPQALSWYGQSWLKWQWVGVTPDMWKCLG